MYVCPPLDRLTLRAVSFTSFLMGNINAYDPYVNAFQLSEGHEGRFVEKWPQRMARPLE